MKPPVIDNQDLLDLYIPCETCDKKPSWGFSTKDCMICITTIHREKQRDADYEYIEKAREDERNKIFELIRSRYESYGFPHGKATKARREIKTVLLDIALMVLPGKGESLKQGKV